jgi:hypothetical protein
MSTTIILVEVDMHFQFPSGGRWKKTFSHKVPYQLVVDWLEQVKNWYYAHGGTINSEDGTLDYPPSLRETALEIFKILEDVRAGRVKVDREIDELTMALKNPEHPRRCRDFGVVPWKFGFRGDIATYRSRRRKREREEEEQRQELEKRLKEHKEKLMADIEWRVAAAVNEMASAQGLPLVQVPSAHFSSCASAAVPEEQMAIEGVQVDSQRYPVDDICWRTTCELHKTFGNIKMKLCLIHAFITSIIHHIYYFDFCGLAFTMLIITN